MEGTQRCRLWVGLCVDFCYIIFLQSQPSHRQPECYMQKLVILYTKIRTPQVDLLQFKSTYRQCHLYCWFYRTCRIAHICLQHRLISDQLTHLSSEEGGYASPETYELPLLFVHWISLSYQILLSCDTLIFVYSILFTITLGNVRCSLKLLCTFRSP